MQQTNFSEILSIINIVVSVVVTVGLFYVGNKARKIETLESSLKTMAETLLDSKMIGCRAEANLKHHGHTDAINAIIARLERGEDHFARLEEKNHKVEVVLLQMLSELKDVVATKDDLDRLRKEIHGG